MKRICLTVALLALLLQAGCGPMCYPCYKFMAMEARDHV